MITDDKIRDLAIRFKIDNFTIFREYLQLLYLRHFYSLRRSEGVYFKGGTAIHFLFGSFRFSEDLDFTSILPGTRLMDLIINTIKEIQVEVPGVTLSDSQERKNSLVSIIKHTEKFKIPVTIRLEFSLREKPLTKKVSPIETLFPMVSYPLVIHLEEEELLAEKVRALLTRGKGRDLFDVWYLLSKEIKLREDFISKKMLWDKKTYSFENLISSIKSFNNKDLKNDLNKFLPRNYRPFIKELKNNLLKKLHM